MAKVDRTNLRQFLRFDQLQNEELVAFLRTKIHIFEQPADVVPWAEKEPHDRLIVYRDQAGKIRRITPGKLTTEETLHNLRALIKSELMQAGAEKVAWTTAFSPVPVLNSFSCDTFGFRPMREGAPQPDQLVAEHPFLLGVKYRSCGSAAINFLRAFKSTTRLSRILSVLLQRRIWVQTRTLPHHWMYVRDAEGSPAIRWLQRGYSPFGAEETDDFEVCSAYAPVFAMKQNWFFSYPPRGVGTDISLVVPESLGEIVERFWTLPPDRLCKAELAMGWLSMFDEVWSASESSGYIALISSIECLLDVKGKTCNECGQPVESATQKFASFLAKWCDSDEGALIAPLKKYYSRRSDLAHGQELYGKDSEPWLRPDLSADKEREEAEHLYHFVNRGFLRWLLAAMFDEESETTGMQH
ncbi:MAG TPA: hypothetical protein VGL56_04425 [Fimbriimonadaceae bacterium]